MSSEFGKALKISVFGQSHGKAIGVVIDGLPAGATIDEVELQKFMDRRRGGRDAMSTARKETDRPVFLAGMRDGATCGSPVCAIIENSDARSGDYASIADTPRPGHADYTAFVKWAGKADMRGGGHFSGRLTAPVCIAGGIAKQLLAEKGIFVGAHLAAVEGIADEPFPMLPDAAIFETVAAKPFPVISDDAGEKMTAAIKRAAGDLDSVGGVIECAVTGVPAGLGGPMFDGIESRLAAALFGIPAVKGVEFGLGFEASALRGSRNNDPFIVENGVIKTLTNNCGGILGGITDGMPIRFRMAVKPTPSIAAPQQSVSLSRMEPAVIEIKGRHDPCIAHRAVPVAEAVAACVILDILLEENRYGAK